MLQLLDPIFYYSIFVVWAATSTVALSKYNKVKNSIKIFILLFCANFLVEATAIICAFLLQHNLEVYNIFSLLEISLISLYFNNSIALFKKYNIGLFVALISVLIGILDMLYLQSIHAHNTYFIIFESIVVICMALFAFARMLIERAGQRITNNPHFWIGIALTFYWTVGFFTWTISPYLESRASPYVISSYLSNYLLNAITCSIYITLFLQQNKWSDSYE